MWYFRGEIIRTPKTIQVDDLRFNKEVFMNSTKLAEVGIKPYSEVKPDLRYFSLGTVDINDSGSEVIGTYIPVAKDTDVLKSNMLSLIKSQLTDKLKATDWYYLRKLRTGDDVPSDIQDYSDTLYSEYDTKKTEINAMTKMSQIMDYENRPHTSVTKVRHDENDKTTWGPETQSATRHINMCTQWTSNPNDDVDPSFVSLTAD